MKKTIPTVLSALSLTLALFLSTANATDSNSKESNTTANDKANDKSTSESQSKPVSDNKTSDKQVDKQTDKQTDKPSDAKADPQANTATNTTKVTAKDADTNGEDKPAKPSEKTAPQAEQKADDKANNKTNNKANGDTTTDNAPEKASETDKPSTEKPASASDSPVKMHNGYQQIQWIDLLPEKELKALTEAPIPDSVIEGSAADEINSPLSMTIKNPVGEYEEALVSTRVKPEYNNRKIKLPGFIVPIDTTEDGKAVSFFLVPFFGACIHLPPPPPNQIIYATFEDGITIDDLETPYWMEATVFTKKMFNDMAVAAYSATADKLYEFKDGDDY